MSTTPAIDNYTSIPSLLQILCVCRGRTAYPGDLPWKRQGSLLAFPQVATQAALADRSRFAAAVTDTNAFASIAFATSTPSPPMRCSVIQSVSQSVIQRCAITESQPLLLSYLQVTVCADIVIITFSARRSLIRGPNSCPIDIGLALAVSLSIRPLLQKSGRSAPATAMSNTVWSPPTPNRRGGSKTEASCAERNLVESRLRGANSEAYRMDQA
eukprot:7228728-Pyramimonas_sp.AAC.2